MLKRFLLPVVALVVMLAPAVISHSTTLAGSNPHVGSATVTYTSPSTGTVTLTFPTGTTTGCTGPLVAVYGSSALKSYVLATAHDFCGDASNPGHIDVEYLGGGDSCPGANFAAYATPGSSSDILGVSDVFAGPCGVNPALIQDNVVAGNMVDLITECPGAALPQGGAANNGTVFSGTACHGNGSGAAGSATMFAPNNLSVNVVYQLFQDNIANWTQVGGTSASAYTQNRTLGSGTRATECYNIYGQGGDNSCLENVPGGSEASTSGTMENDICGAVGGSPADPNGSVGYTSRATLLVSAQTGASANTPTSNCGLIAQGGTTGWNNQCDASLTAPTTANPHGLSGGTGNIVRPSGFNICPGDNDAANGSFTITGYEHYDLSANEQSTYPATAYLNFLNTASEQSKLRAFGFMQTCQFAVSRSFDGGPFSIVSPGC